MINYSVVIYNSDWKARPMICHVSSNYWQRQNSRICFVVVLLMLPCVELQWMIVLRKSGFWILLIWIYRKGMLNSRKYDVWKDGSSMMINIWFRCDRWAQSVFEMIVLYLVGWRDNLKWRFEIGGNFEIFWFFEGRKWCKCSALSFLIKKIVDGCYVGWSQYYVHKRSFDIRTCYV